MRALHCTAPHHTTLHSASRPGLATSRNWLHSLGKLQTMEPADLDQREETGLSFTEKHRGVVGGDSFTSVSHALMMMGQHLPKGPPRMWACWQHSTHLPTVTFATCLQECLCLPGFRSDSHPLMLP